MGTKTVKWLALALTVSLAGPATAADSDKSLAGAWSLDDRSSDDPVHELSGEHGNGLAKRVVRSINVYGFSVGDVLPEEQEKEDPPAPQDVLGPLAYVFEATYRLRITENEGATEIRYGNAPSMLYRASGTFDSGSGWKSTVELRNGELTVEHDRAADGAHISERYWLEARADELHWTARLKKPKSGTVDVKRVFYRAPEGQDGRLQLISAR